MIRAVLFDLGGTLHTASSPPGRDVWFAGRLLERLDDYGVGLDTSAEELARRLAVSSEIYKRASEETLRELPPAEIWSDYYLGGYGVDRALLEPMAEELSFLYDYERVKLMRREGLLETMEELKTMGLRLGIISNIISTSLVPHLLKEYGLDGFMECQIMSSTCGIRKPSPEIFRIAEREMGLGPDELAYVGDTISRDVRGARNAGWRLMIQIRNPAAAHRDRSLENCGCRPDYLIDSLREIPDIIRRESET